MRENTAAAIVVLLFAFGAVGCTKTVTLKESAYNVEVATASSVAASRLECDEGKMISVTTSPHERPESSRWTVPEIKVRNKGASLDATHVVWQDKETFPCRRDGTRIAEGSDEAENARQCKRLSAMTYQCMVGNAPPM